jgi:hypothetical protein
MPHLNTLVFSKILVAERHCTKIKEEYYFTKAYLKY